MWIPIRRAAGVLAVVALCSAPAVAQQRLPVIKKGKQPTVQQDPADANPLSDRQESTDRPLKRTTNKPVTDHSPAQVDQMIAGMLALCNEEEATLGKFAAGHAQHDDVKKFASMMAKDHAQMAKELQKWAPEATLMGREDRTSEDSKATSRRVATSFDPLRVHQQIASRSIASTEKSLGAKSGADFDMAYVGSQCVIHQQMIDKASVLRQYASPELQSAIDKGIEAAEGHLDHAHQLIDKLAHAER